MIPGSRMLIGLGQSRDRDNVPVFRHHPNPLGRLSLTWVGLTDTIEESISHRVLDRRQAYR